MFIYSEDLKDFNEIFRKGLAYDNIKCHSLSLSLSLSLLSLFFFSNTFFKLTPPPLFPSPPPIYLNINHSFLSKWLRFTYFLSENHREFDFFVIAREISKSDFFILQTAEQSYFMKSLQKLLDNITEDIIYLRATDWNFFLSAIFFFVYVDLHSSFRSYR